MSQNTSASAAGDAVQSSRAPWAPIRWTGPLALAGALTVGASLFLVFDALGTFPTTARVSVFIRPNDHPLMLKNVFIDASIGAALGSLTFWAITRLTESPIAWFRRVAVLVTIVYCIAPFVLIDGAPPRMIGALWLMNVSVAATVVGILTYPE